MVPCSGRTHPGTADFQTTVERICTKKCRSRREIPTQSRASCSFSFFIFSSLLLSPKHKCVRVCALLVIPKPAHTRMGLLHLTPNIHLPVVSVTSDSLPADVPFPSLHLLCSYSTHSTCTINWEPFLFRRRTEHTHSRLSFVAVRTFCSRLTAGRRRCLGGCPADNAWASSSNRG